MSYELENEKFISGFEYIKAYIIFLRSHYFVKSSFDIVKETFQTLCIKFRRLGFQPDYTEAFNSSVSSNR